MPSAWIRGLETLTMADLNLVGGKNAALGEMLGSMATLGVAVPGGFAVTARAYRDFLTHSGQTDFIQHHLNGLRPDDVADLQSRAAEIRDAIETTPWPPELEAAIRTAYHDLCAAAGETVSCAVRSSATAEDLPTASFAGQQDTYLHVRGADALLDAIRRCFASLFTARAIAYREHRGFGHLEVALSVGVQQMVRTDTGSAGVIFTLDPESGHRGVVYVTAAYGLGENVVQGKVVPDGYLVHKAVLQKGFPAILDRQLGSKALALRWDETSASLIDTTVPVEEQRTWALTDDEVRTLARWACAIEEHFAKARDTPTPMDIEWGKDGVTGELFILQARPETVHSQQLGRLVQYQITPTEPSLVEGLAVGRGIAAGTARVVADASELDQVQPGDILVARNTDPDWEPVMKIAAALVTEEGGRTSHAAIVAREHGIPAVVAAPDARATLADAGLVTVSCAEGTVGRVYSGSVPFQTEEIDLAGLPELRTKVLVNLADPDQALGVSRLPVDGVGLVRMEFLFAGAIGIHPLALLHPERLDATAAAEVASRTAEWPSPRAFFVERLSSGIARIAAAFHPRPVIVRFSDFKSNEYAHLLGGEAFEPVEENPMIGWRGASRYAHPVFREAFALEVEAMKRVRETLGFDNTHAMIPFCRTPEEGQSVLDELAAGGLARGSGDGVPLKVYVMAEIPSNVLLATEFAALFDGFSIGSNDLTQLVYGVDRDSATVAHLFDDDGPALREACRLLLVAANAADTPVGICGQSPSDHPEFAAFLVGHGIHSVSVTPDAVLTVTRSIAAAEKKP